MLHFMAYFQGEHLGRGSFLDVCLVNKGEKMLFCVSALRLGGEFLDPCPKGERLFVWSQGEIQTLSCTHRGRVA